MSIEETKRVVEAFVESQDGCWLAEGVQLSSPLRVVASGREAVREVLAPLYGASRTNATLTETRFVVADGIAAVEVLIPRADDRSKPDATVGGPHVGPTAAACFYDVAGGEIVRVSVHAIPIDNNATTTRGDETPSLPTPEETRSKT